VVGDLAAMSEHVALGYRFAQATLAHDLGELDRLRPEIEKRWGKSGVVELALAIAIARTYPTIKYAMGYGHTCHQVRVAGDMVQRGAATTVGTHA
jgi:hypothetical protein